MRSVEFESLMRKGEWFHSLRVPHGMWTIVRVDGRSFTKLTERMGFDKPFDADFGTMMNGTAKALITGLSGRYAYVESDEISVLLPMETDLFGREVEKLVSVSAGIASAAFTREFDKMLMPDVMEEMEPDQCVFDARIWIGSSVEHVVDYFNWRMADAQRCAINSCCYWALRKEGKPASEATAHLRGATPGFKRDLLRKREIDFDALPRWMRFGTGLYWTLKAKDGVNPKTGQPVKAIRRALYIDHDLPQGGPYDGLVAAAAVGALDWRLVALTPVTPS